MSEAIDVLKGSAIISVIAVTDLARVGRQIVAGNFRPLEVYLAVALSYLLLDAAPTAASAAATSLAAQLIHWGLVNGDANVRNNGYVPLPPNVQAVAFASLASVRGPGGEVLVVLR